MKRYIEKPSSTKSKPVNIAIVKLHLPFTSVDSVDKVAANLVQLQQLGVTPIVVLDNAEWKFGEYSGYQTISGTKDQKDVGNVGSDRVKEIHESLSHVRSRMIDDGFEIVDAIVKMNGKASLFYNGVFNVSDADSPLEPHCHSSTPLANLTDPELEDANQLKPLLTSKSIISNFHLQQRTSTHINIDLDSLQSALRLSHIPILLPLAQTISNPKNIPISANSALISLTKLLSTASKAIGTSIKKPIAAEKLKIVKIVVIDGFDRVIRNSDGEYATFVNLQDEFDDIVAYAVENPIALRKSYNKYSASMTTDVASTDSYYAHDLSTTIHSLYNFVTVKELLDILPSTCSAIMTSPEETESIITNTITDKPLLPVSLPSSRLNQQTRSPIVSLSSFATLPTSVDSRGSLSQKDKSIRSTVLRHGLKLRIASSISDPSIHLPSLASLLESSFRRTLDYDAYWRRIEHVVDTIVIAGDYEGAAIVTNEWKLGFNGLDNTAALSRKDEKKIIPYLDKFAVAPNSQGIGVADILWLQLLKVYEDLMWRSRNDNKVNNWYFERSTGAVKVSNHWTMFWYGNEGLKMMKEYRNVALGIVPSFLSKDN